jgi:hypothetical protein
LFAFVINYNKQTLLVIRCTDLKPYTPLAECNVGAAAFNRRADSLSAGWVIGIAAGVAAYIATGVTTCVAARVTACITTIITATFFAATTFYFKTNADIRSPFAILHICPCIIEMREEFV